MFMFLFRRNRELRDQLVTYVERAGQAVDSLGMGLRHYRQHGLAGLEEHVRQAHAAESACDQVRRQVERDLFAKALLPESREDIMRLLESLDLVVNQAEDVLRQLHLQRIVLPAAFQEAFAELGERCQASARALLQQAAAALRNDPAERIHEDEVKACESRVDQAEQALVAELFASSLPLAEKLHYRDLVTLTAAISDLAEDSANLMAIFSLKREA